MDLDPLPVSWPSVAAAALWSEGLFVSEIMPISTRDWYDGGRMASREDSRGAEGTTKFPDTEGLTELECEGSAA